MPTAVPTASVKYAGRNYIIEMAAVAALLVAAAWSRHWLIAHAPNHTLEIAAALLPAIPVWGMLIVVWRYYRRIDEFEKQRFLETLAISFGVGSCLVASYTFLADAGFPHLALDWAWPTLAVSWGLIGAIMHFVRR